VEPDWDARRREDIYSRAEWIVERWRKGWRLREIVAEASLSHARHLYPDATDEELEMLASRKGVALSEGSISHYKNSWIDLEDAGFRPDEELLWVSHNLTYSGPGSREFRRELLRKARLMGLAEGRKFFLEEGRRRLRE